MANCPDESATAPSRRSPLRKRSTVAPGAARPAMTASPVRSMRATSKTGTDSAAAGERDDAASPSTAATCVSAAASARERSSRALDAGCNGVDAAVGALVSGADSRRRCVKSEISATPHPATIATNGRAIRPIDIADIMSTLARSTLSALADPAPIFSSHQVCPTGKFI